MDPGKVDPNQEGSIFDSQGGSSHSLQDLPVGDWSDYNERVVEYRGPINQLARVLEKLRDQKFEHQKRFSRDHSILPENGDVGRFNPKKEFDRIIKHKSGKLPEGAITNASVRTKRCRFPPRMIWSSLSICRAV